MYFRINFSLNLLLKIQHLSSLELILKFFFRGKLALGKVFCRLTTWFAVMSLAIFPCQLVYFLSDALLSASWGGGAVQAAAAEEMQKGVALILVARIDVTCGT